MAEILDLLALFNPWWANPDFLPREVKWPARDIFTPLYQEVLSSRQISTLTGLRRTGKSTLIKQILGNLLLNTPPSRIVYLPFDEPMIEEDKEVLENLIQTYLREIVKKNIYDLKQTHYLFLDEIQLVPFWQDILKRYYDLTPNLKFIITGSASLNIRQKSKESLAGRISEHTLPPLSFREWQSLGGKGSFETYLQSGGFPELLYIPEPGRQATYLKEGVIGKIIEVDLPKITGIRLLSDFERLFWTLLPNTGQVMNFPRLSADLGIKRPTLFRYLSLLKNTLLIQEVLNIAGSFRSEKRVLRKIYPASPNFISQTPAQAETYTANTLAQKFSSDLYLYSQRGEEIDFVLPRAKLAIEVKYQNQIHPQDYKILLRYCQKKNYQPVLLTKNTTHSLPRPIISLPVAQLESFKF